MILRRSSRPRRRWVRAPSSVIAEGVRGPPSVWSPRSPTRRNQDPQEPFGKIDSGPAATPAEVRGASRIERSVHHRPRPAHPVAASPVRAERPTAGIVDLPPPPATKIDDGLGPRAGRAGGRGGFRHDRRRRDARPSAGLPQDRHRAPVADPGTLDRGSRAVVGPRGSRHGRPRPHPTRPGRPLGGGERASRTPPRSTKMWFSDLRRPLRARRRPAEGRVEIISGDAAGPTAAADTGRSTRANADARQPGGSPGARRRRYPPWRPGAGWRVAAAGPPRTPERGVGRGPRPVSRPPEATSRPARRSFGRAAQGVCAAGRDHSGPSGWTHDGRRPRRSPVPPYRHKIDNSAVRRVVQDRTGRPTAVRPGVPAGAAASAPRGCSAPSGSGFPRLARASGTGPIGG